MCIYKKYNKDDRDDIYDDNMNGDGGFSPKSTMLDQFNYESGELGLTFIATRYMSPQIDLKAKQLRRVYRMDE